MVHLRIVAPPDRAEQVHALLCATPSAIDMIRVPNASTRPDGDLIMCDVAREDASVIISELTRARHPPRRVDLAQPDGHDLRLRGRGGQARARLAGRRRDLGGARPAHERERRAVRRVPALHGARGDHRRDRDLPRQRRSWSSARWSSGRSSARSRACASRSSRRAASSRAARRSRSRSASRWRSAPRSLATLLFDAADLVPDTFDTADHALAKSISSPDAFAFIVAACAGTAGMLSL